MGSAPRDPGPAPGKPGPAPGKPGPAPAPRDPAPGAARRQGPEKRPGPETGKHATGKGVTAKLLKRNIP